MGVGFDSQGREQMPLQGLTGVGGEAPSWRVCGTQASYSGFDFYMVLFAYVLVIFLYDSKSWLKDTLRASNSRLWYDKQVLLALCMLLGKITHLLEP